MKITSILFSIGLIISNWTLAQGKHKDHNSDAQKAAKKACKSEAKQSPEKKQCIENYLKNNPPAQKAAPVK